MTPYQPHSETSKEAADRLTSKRHMYGVILTSLLAAETEGLTGDELLGRFSPETHRGTVSARLIELEREGEIVKTNRTRKSRLNRPSSIYVLSKFATETDRLPPKKRQRSKDVAALEKIAGIFFTMCRKGQMHSGDCKIIVTPFDLVMLNKLAKIAKIDGV